MRPAVALLALLLLAAERAPAPIVEIDSGKILGARVGPSRDGLAFKGIPYAAPPVGDLRWRPPKPVAPWEGVKRCTEFGPACLQPGGFGRYGGARGAESEDCLTLNVWAPAESADGPRPVLFWIHGGGMVIGSGSIPIYDGAALAREGAVVVTINYRLGPFGFLGHPLLGKESEHGVSGNYGLLDQVAALRWVKRNIAVFGGDPRRVTIFGESAGGVSVCCLMATPLAKGLFSGAIGQSGGSLGVRLPLRSDDASADSLERRGRKLFEEFVGEDEAPLAAMRKVPAEALLKTAKPIVVGIDRAHKYGPVVDGWVLPEKPDDAWAAGRQHDVPLLVGSTKDDGSVFAGVFAVKTPFAYRAAIRRVHGKNAAEVLALFPAKTREAVRPAALRYLTVSSFAAPARRHARWMGQVSSKAWLYQFSRVPPAMVRRGMGAIHGIEVPYVFGNLPPVATFEDTDRELSRTLRRIWVRFAATGDPNDDGLPKWPEYTAEKDLHLEFGDRIRPAKHLFRQECDLFDRLR